jgi:hypothetical protein
MPFPNSFDAVSCVLLLMSSLTILPPPLDIQCAQFLPVVDERCVAVKSKCRLQATVNRLQAYGGLDAA